MPLLKNPFKTVDTQPSKLQSILQLADTLIQRGVTGVRRKITRKDFVEIKWIKLKDLKIDDRYQRLLNTNFIKKAKAFKPDLTKPISVFLRPDGDQVVVDGQHTSILGAVYVEDPSEFEIECQVHTHPKHFTVDQCIAAEAKYFEDINSTRTNITGVALFRSQLAQNEPKAVLLEQNFIKLGVHIELIGAPDDGTNAIKGFRGITQSISKYGIPYVQKAIILYKSKIADPKLKKWNTPLHGNMIFGLTALFHFLDAKGLSKKADNLFDYMDNWLFSENGKKEITDKTAGVIQDILIVERVVGWYNHVAGPCGYKKINTTGKANVIDQWKLDPIHDKKKLKESADQLADDDTDLESVEE